MIADEVVNQIDVEARLVRADSVFTALPNFTLGRTLGSLRRIQLVVSWLLRFPRITRTGLTELSQGNSRNPLRILRHAKNYSMHRVTPSWSIVRTVVLQFEFTPPLKQMSDKLQFVGAIRQAKACRTLTNVMTNEDFCSRVARAL